MTRQQQLTPGQASYYQNNCSIQVKTSSKYATSKKKIDVTCLVLNTETKTLQNFCNSANTRVSVTLVDDANQEFPAQTVPASNFFLNGQVSFSIQLSEGFKPIGSRIRIKVSTNIGNSRSAVLKSFSAPLLLCRGTVALLTEPPEKWFKDEGGKSNCIPLEVVLDCKDRSRISGIENIPLRATLLYEDGQVVPISDILHPIENMSLPTFGKTLIQFKVSHCSQSHQGKLFRIQIAPDTQYQPELSDIQPVVTRAFQVKSKRRRTSKQIASMAPFAPITAQQAGRPAAKRARVQEELPLLQPRSTPLLRPLPPAAVGMQPKPSVQPASVMKSAGCLTMPSKPYAVVSSTTTTVKDLMKTTTGCEELKTILSWVGSTLGTLESLQWEHVGFSLDRNGEPDACAPIYKCPGCKKYKENSLGQPGMHTLSCPIANNLKDYSTSIRPLFLSLASRIEGFEKKSPNTGSLDASTTLFQKLKKEEEEEETPKCYNTRQKPFFLNGSSNAVTLVDEPAGQAPELTPAPPPPKKPVGLGRKVSDAILQSPAFQRHVSDVILGLLPQIQEPASLTEQRVAFILGGEFDAGDRLRMPAGAPNWGHAAFDCNRQLLGFYVSHYSGALGSPLVKFYDTTQWASLDTGDIEGLAAELSARLAEKAARAAAAAAAGGEEGAAEAGVARAARVFAPADHGGCLRRAKEALFRDVAAGLTFQDFTEDDVLELYASFDEEQQQGQQPGAVDLGKKEGDGEKEQNKGGANHVIDIDDNDGVPAAIPPSLTVF